MKNLTISSLLLAAAAFCLTGCQSQSTTETTATQPVAAPAAPATPTAPTTPTATATVMPAAPEATPIPAPTSGGVIRIAAGATTNVVDSEGNVWLPDQGFDGGDTIQRPDVQVTNTPDPMIYQAEHYGMDSFSWKLPNGKYQVKLHFAETYEGIQGPGERVFSFDVQGQKFDNFDVWQKAGGPLKAYVVTVNVDVSNGQLLINFTPNIENPQINGIEIIPMT